MPQHQDIHQICREDSSITATMDELRESFRVIGHFERGQYRLPLAETNSVIPAPARCWPNNIRSALTFQRAAAPLLLSPGDVSPLAAASIRATETESDTASASPPSAAWRSAQDRLPRTPPPRSHANSLRLGPPPSENRRSSSVRHRPPIGAIYARQRGRRPGFDDTSCRDTNRRSSSFHLLDRGAYAARAAAARNRRCTEPSSRRSSSHNASENLSRWAHRIANHSHIDGRRRQKRFDQRRSMSGIGRTRASLACSCFSTGRPSRALSLRVSAGRFLPRAGTVAVR